MKKTDVVEYIKALELKPGSILIIDANQFNLADVLDLKLPVNFPVPILAVDGPPSIERFTRAELAEALRLLDQVSGGSAGASGA
jgi:hypothetical protein